MQTFRYSRSLLNRHAFLGTATAHAAMRYIGTDVGMPRFCCLEPGHDPTLAAGQPCRIPATVVCQRRVPDADRR